MEFFNADAALAGAGSADWRAAAAVAEAGPDTKEAIKIEARYRAIDYFARRATPAGAYQ